MRAAPPVTVRILCQRNLTLSAPAHTAESGVGPQRATDQGRHHLFLIGADDT